MSYMREPHIFKHCLPKQISGNYQEKEKSLPTMVIPAGTRRKVTLLILK